MWQKQKILGHKWVPFFFIGTKYFSSDKLKSILSAYSSSSTVRGAVSRLDRKKNFPFGNFFSFPFLLLDIAKSDVFLSAENWKNDQKWPFSTKNERWRAKMGVSYLFQMWVFDIFLLFLPWKMIILRYPTTIKNFKFLSENLEIMQFLTPFCEYLKKGSIKVFHIRRFYYPYG